MKFRSPTRWHRLAGALALLLVLAASATQAKPPASARTSKVAATPQAVPATTPPTPATIINDHIFTALNGQTPSQDLVVDGAGNVYGTTQSGGTNAAGTIFRVGTDGTITTFHNFGTAANSVGYSADGNTPVAGLLLAPDGLLYGTTTQGGANNYGTVFSINPADGALTTLASFDQGTTGYYSTAPLTTDGNGNFYGTAQYNGNLGYGTLFVYRAGTGTLTALAGFDYYSTGRYPAGKLLFGADGNLYGTTQGGNQNGTVFQYNLTTNALTAIFNFANYGAYGYNPIGGLVQDANGNLYGTTAYDGANGGGAVFELAEDTTVNPPTFTPSVLYSFGSGNTDFTGYSPQGALLFGTDGNLYGTAAQGGTAANGASGQGAVFRLVLTAPATAPGATTFGSITDLHDFDFTDGYGPNGTLATDAAGNLYGTFPYGNTQSGGVFELTATATAGQYGFADLYQFPGPDGNAPVGGLTLGADGNLYGTTQRGGANDEGSVFVYNPTTGVITTLYSFFYEQFNGAAPVYDGNNPNGKLVAAANGVFYGTTENGGSANGYGTVYQLTTATDPATGAITATETTLYAFTNSGASNDAVGTNAVQGDGAYPIAGLTLAQDGTYYGTTENGGPNNAGTVFQFNPTTGAVTTLAAFDNNATGGYPTTPLVLAENGSLYGTTEGGGANNVGAVYQFNPTAQTLTLAASFTEGSATGYNPIGGLTLGADGFLYGTTVSGGTNNDGTLFQVDPATTTGTITPLVTFNGLNGYSANSPLVQDADGNFYGTTNGGGANNDGTVFQYNPDTGAFVTLADFGFGAGFGPTGGLTLTADGRLFGVTAGGENEEEDDLGLDKASKPSETKAKGSRAHAAVKVNAKAQARQLARTKAVTKATATGSAPNAVGGPLAVTDPLGTIYEVAITPTITSSATAVGTVGTAFTFQVTGTSNPTAFTATGLPAGLTINAATGLITGTPTAAGTSTVTVTASNAGGTASQTLTVVIQPAVQPPPATPPTVTSTAPPSGTVGTAYSYQITASNTPTSFGATGLPAGLTIDPTTGLISGTPTAAGTFAVTFSATNSGGTSSASFSLTIVSNVVVTPPPTVTAPAITSAASANVVAGQPFSYQITASNTPTSFGATGLPAGLGVNAATGLITGTPTTVGTFPIALSATNSGGTGTATLTLTVTAVPSVAPVIGSAASTSGQVGQPFDYQITASNTPTSFGATGLPAGLTIDPTTGLISGTPTAAGTFTVALSSTNTGGTGTASLSLTVTAAVLQVPVVTSATAESGQVAVAFSYQIVASNSPIVYGATGLPAGLVLNDTTGVISGTPTAAGTFAVTIMATNSAGSGTATLTLTIAAQPLPVITIIASIPNVMIGTGQLATFAVTRTGGDPTQTLAVSYKVGGQAVAGTDYLALKGVKTFKPGKTTVRINVTPEGTLNGDDKKGVKVTLLPGDGYTLGTAITARVHILAPQ